ncbi:Uncharacterised protein [Tsukamurella paurometabola]|uniref:Uncharacterized protein n=1 Tax=Tsukamurella paurometabola TaxID=2061 RepID=A0A3P8JYK1_TSUPA|nr:Uncharacterised protein [Tsukamurella paurometabola]
MVLAALPQVLGRAASGPCVGDAFPAGKKQ